MNPSTRLQTDEENVLKYLKKGKEAGYSSMMIQIADGKVVFIEVSEKIRL